MSFIKKLVSLQLSTLGLQLIVVLLTLNGAVMIWANWSLQLSKERHLSRATATMQNLAQSLDLNIHSKINEINITLMTVVDELENREISGVVSNEDEINRFLREQKNHLNQLVSLQVSNTEGNIQYGSEEFDSGKSLVTWRNQPFFQQLSIHAKPSLSISSPHLSPDGQQWLITFSRRYNHVDGSFAGIVSANIATTYFNHLFSALELNNLDIVVLRDNNHGLIARQPQVNNTSGQVGSREVSPQLQQLFASGVSSANYQSISKVDHINRIESYRHLNDLPFHLIVGISTEDYLADWYTEVMRTIAAVLFFMLVTSIATWILWRAIVKIRDETEHSQLLLRNASDGVHILNRSGVLIEASNSFYRMLGYAEKELCGQKPNHWDTRYSDTALSPHLATLFSKGKQTIFETQYRRKNGSLFDVEVSTYPLKLDGVPVLFAAARDISERKRNEQLLIESESRMRVLFESNQSAMLLIDPEESRIISANQAALTFYGYTREQLVKMHLSDLTVQNAHENTQEYITLLSEQGVTTHSHRRADNSLRHVEIYSTTIHFSEKSLLFCIIHDMTDRRLAEEKLRLAASVFTHAREGIIVTTPEGVIIEANNAVSDITGYSRDEILGHNPRIFKSDRHPPSHYANMWSELIAQNHWTGEVWNRHKNGHIYAQMQNISVIRNQQGKIEHFVALFSDITALKEHASELERIAHYDPLTGLPNRLMLSQRINSAMDLARQNNQLMSVAYLDLDGFKQINDQLGHEAGDQLLVTLAKRMQENLRADDTLSRLGGDEFIAVFNDLNNVEDSLPIINRLLAIANQSVLLGDTLFNVSASIGVTFYPQPDDVDADQLLRQADQAMYQAKLAGKNRYHIFDTNQDRSVRGYHESLEHIQYALNHQQFVLYYQPKVNLRTGEVIGAEALIRWQHPERGVLPPSMFLPMIENHALEIGVGEWVINQALTQMELWRQDGIHVPVSVNIGAHQLQHADFIPRLRSLLAHHPVTTAGHLELEVLESSALQDLASVAKVIRTCKMMGVTCALDDFGTGYSSMTYLKHLPVSNLKIDQSFVRDMLSGSEDLAIVRGIIGLASAFRRQVIAEGVETKEQALMLMHVGCEHAQGYGIAKPMPASEFKHWMAQWHTNPLCQSCLNREPSDAISS